MRLKCSIAAVVALCVCAGSVAYGQVIAGERSEKKRAEKQQRQAKKQGVAASGQVDAFAKQLGLTDEQKGKVQTVVTSYRTGVRDIMQNTSYKPEEQKSRVDALRTKSDLEIRAILTAQQSEQAQKDNSIQKLLGVGPARPNFREVADKLQLTDAQKQQFQDLNKDMRAKQKAISQDTTLTDEARREKLKALNQERQEKILAILTDEQEVKYKELMSSQPRIDKSKATGEGKVKNKVRGKKASKHAEPAVQ